jgi:hypothetical protein
MAARSDCWLHAPHPPRKEPTNAIAGSQLAGILGCGNVRNWATTALQPRVRDQCLTERPNAGTAKNAGDNVTSPQGECGCRAPASGNREENAGAKQTWWPAFFSWPRQQMAGGSEAKAAENAVGCGGSAVPRLANVDSLAAASVAPSKSNCCDHAQTARRCLSFSKLRRLQRLDGLAEGLLPLSSDFDEGFVVGIEPRLAKQVEVVVGVHRQINRRSHSHVGTHGGIK